MLSIFGVSNVLYLVLCLTITYFNGNWHFKLNFNLCNGSVNTDRKNKVKLVNKFWKRKTLKVGKNIDMQDLLNPTFRHCKWNT